MKYLKVIAALLSLALLPLGLLSCSGGTSFTLPQRRVVEGEAQSFGSYKYLTYDDGSVIITEYTGSETAIVVPDRINNASVVALGEDVFADNTTLQSIRLNSSLEVIGDYCFYGCTALSELSFGKRVWSVGLAAFEDTPWLAAQTEEFVIVGDGVLLKYQGSATEVELPAGVRHIAYAFNMNEQLISVRASEGVYTVGSGAFAYCTSLRSVELGDRLCMIGEGAFDGCEGLTSVALPDSLEYIGPYAFNYCIYLNEAKLGGRVSYIGEYAFRNCMRMKLLELPGTVSYVGEYAFADCYTLTLVFFDGTAEKFEALELSSSNYILRDVDKIYLK